MRARPLGIALLGLAFCALAACSPSSRADGDGGGSTIDAGNGGDGGDVRCTSAAGCPGDQVCDPTTQTCAVLSCTTHTECGSGAFCERGTCTHSMTGSACDSMDNCAGGDLCIGGRCGCAGAAVSAQGVPPNVLIVLDRSDSMNGNPAGESQSKWTIAKATIAALLADAGAHVRFGLALYPGVDQPCTYTGQFCEANPAGAIFVPPADATQTTINAFLAGAGTCFAGTPTAEMLSLLPGFGGLTDTTRDNYVLLITDGESTCTDPVPWVSALAAQSPPVATFVVGFGNEVDPTELNALAVAGGTAIPGGPPSYYQANNGAQLAAAFDAITGGVLPCTYVLAEEPEDLDMLYVYVNDLPVARDPGHTTGWDWDPAQSAVVFYGASCDALRAGQANGVTLVYGCEIPID